MTRYFMIFAFAVFGMFLVPLAQPSAAMQRQVAACPDNAIGLRNSNALVECYCSATATRSGSVWGTNEYSDDSRICRAAVHSGVIGLNGGQVVIEATPGRSSYQPSTRNGVASRSWGSWQGSFRFVGDSNQIARTARCPTNATSLRGTGQTLRCHCPASDTGSGSVWGTNVYTDDSRICRAAVHAGAIGPSGGEVVIRALSGRNGYNGSTRNGVGTRNYARWHGSFSFE